MPVVRIERAEDAPALASTLSGAGLPCIEITFRTAAAADAIGAIRAEVPEMLVGAGTVVSLAQLDAALAAGADVRRESGPSGRRRPGVSGRGHPVFPGVVTPTEVIRALDAGLSARQALPGLIRRRPRLSARPGRPVPVGAVHADRRDRAADLEAYLGLPSVLAVGGSWMVRPDLLAARDWATVGRLAAEAVAAVRAARGPIALMTLTLSAVGRALGPGRAGRGDAAPRSGRGADPHHPQFRAWEGGGEYNVARGLRRCFGSETTVVTAFADNPIGRLIEDLIRQGGVDRSHLRWVPYDGIGQTVRNGLNFTERGFGVRGAVGCSDRANSAASQLPPGTWTGKPSSGPEGARWLHTGGIFAALSGHHAGVVAAAIEAAHRHGTVVSFDLNFRESLWRAAVAVRPPAGPAADRRAGRRGDRQRGGLRRRPGHRRAGVDAVRPTSTRPRTRRCWRYRRAVPEPARDRRDAAGRPDREPQRLGRPALADGVFHPATTRRDLDILDRIGGGDSFASGLIHGYLAGHAPEVAVEYGAAHGALAMTTPGDTSMATLAEVEALMAGAGARVSR